MPAHADAIGYIRDLGHSEGLPWLEMICDLAAAGTTTLGPTDLEILFQLFDLGPLFPDDDPGAGRVDIDLGLVGSPLNLDPGYSCVVKFLLQKFPDLQILMEQFRIVLFREPLRSPRLDAAQPQPDRVNLLPQPLTSSSLTARPGSR